MPAILGAPASLAGGMNVTLNYSNYPSFDFDGFSFGPDFSDTFTPSSDATAITFESASGKPCGMSYPNIGVDSPGRVVFLSFPFDAMPTNGPAPNNAVALLQNIVRFLAPGANGVGVVFLDNTVYTTNDLVTVEVGDSDLAGAGPDAGQLRRQLAHQSHHGHAAGDNASGVVPGQPHAGQRRGGDQPIARAKRRHHHRDLFRCLEQQQRHRHGQH